MFNQKNDPAKELVRRFHPGVILDTTDAGFLAAFGPVLDKAANEVRVERAQAEIALWEKPLPTLRRAIEVTGDAVRAGEKELSGLEAEKTRWKAKLSEMASTGDFSPGEMSELEGKIRDLENKLFSQPKLSSANEAHRKALNEADRFVSRLQKWQTREEKDSGLVRLGNWQAHHLSLKTGTPSQQARKLLGLSDHALEQMRTLEAGKLPRLRRSVLGFSRRQVSIPFLSFVLDDNDL